MVAPLFGDSGSRTGGGEGRGGEQGGELVAVRPPSRHLFLPLYALFPGDQPLNQMNYKHRYHCTTPIHAVKALFTATRLVVEL